ncbi:ABC transporter permease [Pseudactinotalea sp. Z1739]|uniref:ABC transporter permease n=1 Tax=Pseudactinotalea sp. Z1739 TaxID=3413028 RepID=UPI003C79FEBE
MPGAGIPPGREIPGPGVAVGVGVGDDGPSGGPRKERPRSWLGRHGHEWRIALKKDWRLYSLLVLPVIWFLIFRYIPMAGNVIAVRRYRPGGSIFGDEFVGLRYFRMILGDASFWNAFENTLILGGLSLAIVFPLPIILALMLNELRSRVFKRTVQTISYLPHFMSIVVVAAMVLQIVSIRGTINQILDVFGAGPISFMQQSEWFRTIFITSEIWQTVGWGTILYLAALTTIDPQLYEASRVDGASKWRQTWHVTLPGIRPTMVVLLILNMGNFLSVSFEKVLLLYNPLLYPTADVIATYLYRVGLQGANFSYAAAIGFFEAIIGAILIVGANLISRRLVGESLW